MMAKIRFKIFKKKNGETDSILVPILMLHIGKRDRSIVVIKQIVRIFILSSVCPWWTPSITVKGSQLYISLDELTQREDSRCVFTSDLFNRGSVTLIPVISTFDPWTFTPHPPSSPLSPSHLLRFYFFFFCVLLFYLEFFAVQSV